MITMKNIVREGHPSLSRKAQELACPLSEHDRNTLREMREFLINSQEEDMAEKYALRPGVGLAAPQINLSKRMLAIYTLDENFEELHDYLMVNPRIISHSEAKTYMPGGEGCLSVDREVTGLVPRYKKVTVQTNLYHADTDTLTETTLRLKGIVSIVFQHELDHLNGILFTERVKLELPELNPLEFKSIEENNKEEDL